MKQEFIKTAMIEDLIKTKLIIMEEYEQAKMFEDANMVSIQIEELKMLLLIHGGYSMSELSEIRE